MQAQDILKNAKRIVVKVGSSLVTNEGQGLDAAAVGNWCEQIAKLVKSEQPREIIMVSSGAIAEGIKRLGWAKRPQDVHELQAAAAVGQMGLAQMYETQFKKHNLGSAQVLLTHADLADRERYLNSRGTLLALLKHKIIPVINENDTVITDEIKVGDNDTLGALVANLIEADLLVILTDQKGLYTADPRKNPEAKFIHTANAGDKKLEEMAGGAGSNVGTGGMITKILAAKRAAGQGASTAIAWGREEKALEKLLSGENIGTLLIAPTQKNQARKQWIMDHLQLRGVVKVDDGAQKKIKEEGKSLLPIGISQVSGEFIRGDVVSIQNSEGKEIARGLANYSSAEIRLLAGKASTEIKNLLGYFAGADIIHRDNMIINK